MVLTSTDRALQTQVLIGGAGSKCPQMPFWSDTLGDSMKSNATVI